MDPNANLQEQLRLAMRLVDVDESREQARHSDSVAHDAARLAELVIALNNWIVDGGFLPTQWRRR